LDRYVKEATAAIESPSDVQRNYEEKVSLLEFPVKTDELLVTQFEKPLSGGKTSAAAGLLLYGLPGGGKTSAAERIAYNGQCALLKMKHSTVNNHLVGKSEKYMEGYIEACLRYKHGQHGGKGIVLLLDEIDGLLPSNVSKHNRSIVSTFNAVVDPARLRANTVVIVATTNDPDAINAAVKSRITIKHEMHPPDDKVLAGVLRKMIEPRIGGATGVNTCAITDDELCEFVSDCRDKNDSFRDMDEIILGCIRVAVSKDMDTLSLAHLQEARESIQGGNAPAQEECSGATSESAHYVLAEEKKKREYIKSKTSRALLTQKPQDCPDCHREFDLCQCIFMHVDSRPGNCARKL
jgi:SpoVK/Ycf46/Vps4 family AAA+-type ATPase